MSFLFYTDLHLQGCNPKHRVDDYPAALLAKLKEVYEIAQEKQVEFVLFGGDFFHVHKIFSYQAITNAMKIICKSRLMTYAIVGQHDLNGYNVDTYLSSTLCFMESHCSNWHTIIEPVKVGKYTLSASHSWDKLLTRLQRPEGAEISILMAHQLIADNKKSFPAFLSPELQTNHDLILAGDLHEGFETHRIGETTFCNPGSLARLEMNKVFENRPIQVAIVDYVQEGNVWKPQISKVALKCVKPEEEVFGKTLYEKLQEHTGMDTSQLVNLLEGIEYDPIDLYDLIEKMASKYGLKKEALDYLLSKRKES